MSDKKSVMGASIRVSQIREAMEVAVHSDVAIHFQGDSGIGKTEEIAAAARALDLDLHVLNLGDTLIEDIGAYRVDQATRTLETYLQPLFVWNGHKRPALFVDEANRAGRDIRNMLAKMVTERRLLGRELPRDLVLVAASNPAEKDFADVEDFWADLATVRRWCVIDVEADVETWLQWARRNGVDARVMAFLQENPGFLVAGQACPRNWAKASRVLQRSPERAWMLLPGLVGQAWFAFQKFLGRQKWLTARDVLTRYHEVRDELVQDPDAMIRIARELARTRLAPVHRGAVCRFLLDLPKEARYAAVLQLLQGVDGASPNTRLVNQWIRANRDLYALLEQADYA